MPQIARLIGGAGTGKTTELMGIMDRTLAKVLDPMLIGFSTFTRAARREAANRAGDRFNMKPKELENDGWFRTLHSVAYRCLGIGKDELLTDSKEDRDWLRQYFNGDAPARGAPSMSMPLDDSSVNYCVEEANDADLALGIWDAARARLEPFRAVWREADETDDRTPDLDFCLGVVRRYEQAKRLDHRADFTDLLARFAGRSITTDGAEQCEPEGETPQVEAWFFDEWQDSSALGQAVANRLMAAESVRYVYYAGDPFQAIYRWAGASPRNLMDLECHKSRVMPQSWRCGAPILALGEEQLRDCSDYFDRRIAPARDEGVIDSAYIGGLAQEVDPREQWLVLARTNYLARKVGKLLDDGGVPWLPTRGGGTWAAPVRNRAITAMMSLEGGAWCDGADWKAVLKHLPCKAGGVDLLARGTKSRFDGLTEEQAAEQHSWIQADGLAEVGATPGLVEAIRSRQWRTWIEGAGDYLAAVEQYGAEAVAKPRIRVGTVHSVKGSEADNVALLTTISGPCFRSAQSQEGFNEERRVCYVGITRARKRLLVVQEKRPAYRWKIEP